MYYSYNRNLLSSEKRISKVHPLNLILLKHFFSISHTEYMFADTSFVELLDISICTSFQYVHIQTQND